MPTMMIQPPEDRSFEGFSQQDFLALGVNEVAYVKPATIDGRAMIAIHAANGAAITATSSLEKAVALIKQNDLEPLAVH